MTDRFGGILPAAVTPFDAAGRFRRDSFETLLLRCYDAGADGVYICGTTGEGPLQPTRQRKEVAEAAVDLSPAGAQVIVHVGAPSTDEAVELARHAAKAGATAVSSLPPVGGYGFAEIRAYYARLAEEAGIPLFVYYYPEIYATQFDPEGNPTDGHCYLASHAVVTVRNDQTGVVIATFPTLPKFLVR